MLISALKSYGVNYPDITNFYRLGTMLIQNTEIKIEKNNKMITCKNSLNSIVSYRLSSDTLRTMDNSLLSAIVLNVFEKQGRQWY